MKLLASWASWAAVLGLLAGSAAAEPDLTQLRDLDDLRTAFNQDQGVPRVVLLLSPT